MTKNFKNQRGQALIITLILLVVAIIGGLTLLKLSNTGTKITGALTKHSNVSECNDSALNIMTLNLNSLMQKPTFNTINTKPENVAIKEIPCPQCVDPASCPSFDSYYDAINWTEYETAAKDENNNNSEIASYLSAKCKISYRMDKVNEESCDVTLNSIEIHPDDPKIYKFEMTSSSKSKAVTESTRATMTTRPPEYAWLSDYPIIIGPDLHMLRPYDAFIVYIEGKIHSNSYLMLGLQNPTSTPPSSYMKFYIPSTFPGTVASSVGTMMQFFKMYNYSRDTAKTTSFYWDTYEKNGKVYLYYNDMGYTQSLKSHPDTTVSSDFVVPTSDLGSCDVALSSANRCWKLAMDDNPFKDGLGYWGRLIEEDHPDFKGKFATGVDPVVPKPYQAFKDAGVDPRERIEPMKSSDDEFLRANKLVYKADCIILDGIAVDVNGSPLSSGTCFDLSNNTDVIQPKQTEAFYYAPAGQMINSYDVEVRKLTELYPGIKKLFIGSTAPTNGEIRYPTPNMDVTKYLDDGASTPSPLYNALCINENGLDCAPSPSDIMGSMDVVTLTGKYPKGDVEITTNLTSVIKGEFNREWNPPKKILLHSDSNFFLSGEFNKTKWIPDSTGNIVEDPNTVTASNYYTLVLDTSQILPTIERFQDGVTQKFRGTQLNFFQSKFFPPRRGSKSVNDWKARTIRNLHTAGIINYKYEQIFSGVLPEDLNIPGVTGIRLLSVERIK